MINISSYKQLDIILPNTNKALAKVLANATPTELEIISNGKDLKSIMNTILKQSGDTHSSDKTLLELVKNNPTLKNLGDVSKTIKDLLNAIKSDKEQLPIEKTLKNFLSDIKDLKNSELKQKLENSGVFLESRLKNAKNPQVELKNTLTTLVKTLQNSSSPSAKATSNQIKILLNNEILKSTSNIDVTRENRTNIKALIQLSSKIENIISKLKQDVIIKTDPILKNDVNLILNKLQTLNTPEKLNSGQNVKDIISSDLKAVLMQASEEMAKSPHANQSDILKHIDKLSLQIDHYQLLSHLSNGSSLYLPFSWDMMEDGNIQMKKSDDEKFYCDIDLKLKEYGELNLKLTLFEENQLNLHIYSASEKFKALAKENIPSLRSALIETQITPREIRVFEPKLKTPTSPYQNQEDNIYMGFEVKA